MTSPIKAWEMSNNTENFRSAIVNEPRIFGGPYGIHTPQGTVPVQSLPALPPRPYVQQQSYGMGGGNTYGSGMYGSGMYGGNSMFGGGLGTMGYGASSYGSGMYGGGGMGYGGYGGGAYGGYNRFGGGPNPMDPESRFIQIAEESSRPAFQSIESLVSAIGNIAAMLDSTFFAITSSFRAILGVAANFGRLRGVFAQFWSTFAIFRGMTWLYRKIMYFMKMSNVDPSTAMMGEAFAAAQGMPSSPDGPNKKSTAWPILVFLGFIFTAPYLIMKLLGTVSTTALEETRIPRTWVNPIKAQVKHTFQASNPQELSMRQGQTIYIAPREIQNTQQLLNTGWVLATIDNQTSGIIPLNYIQGPQQVRQNVDVVTPATESKDFSEAATLGQQRIFEEPTMMSEKPIAEPTICDIPTDFDGNNVTAVETHLL